MALFRNQYSSDNSSRTNVSADVDKLLGNLVATPSATTKKPSGKQGKDVVLSDPQQLLERKWSNKHNVGGLQFLALVKNKMHQEEPVLIFNYFGMHRRSIEILRLIRTREDHKFKQYFTDRYMPNDSLIANFVILVHHVARGSAQGGQELGLHPRDAGVASRMLVSCNEVMKGYLAKKGDVARKELKVFCKNKNSPHIEMDGDGPGAKDEEADNKFMYLFGLEEVLDPKVMASLMTGIPIA